MRATNLRAIVHMLLGVAIFSLMDAGMKRMAASYPPLEVTFLRAIASLPFLLGSIAWSRAWDRLTVQSRLLYCARAVIGIVMLWTFVFAVGRQGLTDTYAVFMSAPLLVAGLSHVVLGERVTARRWFAITVGLVGVLIALKPRGTGLVSAGGLAAIVSAACYALGVLSIRVMGRTDSPHALVFWYMVLLTLGAALLAWPGWQPVAPQHWLLIAFIGLTGALGQHFLTSAFRLASPPSVAPFEYTALVWGVALDYALFQIVPAPRVLLGGAIVIAGGLYVIWDERRATAALPSAVLPG